MSCNCCNNEKCENEHEENISNTEKILYILSIILILISFIPAINKYKAILVLIAIILSGYKMIISGIKNLLHLNFEEDTLMTIAVIAAFILGEQVEAAMVIILFRLGEFIEDKAVDKSNSNIEEIVNIKAETATRIEENETTQVIDVNNIKVGDRILIKPGEKVPVDCIIIKGNSELDTSAITGESATITVRKKSRNTFRRN